MNEPTDPSNTGGNSPPPLPAQPRGPGYRSLPSTPPPAGPPLPQDAGLNLVLESLLKRPSELVDGLNRAGSSRLLLLLGGAAFVALAGYGLLVGSFSGGVQLLAAPLKISLGALATALICLPSLFIFLCLSGAEISLRGVSGVLAAVLALTALLMVGFAPVAWVFSQSTDSVTFVGGLHLAFWLIALGFGLRLLRYMADLLRVRERFHLRVWMLIFLLVSLQMTTALRPIVGTSPDLLPRKKKPFLVHWTKMFSGK